MNEHLQAFLLGILAGVIAAGPIAMSNGTTTQVVWTGLTAGSTYVMGKYGGVPLSARKRAAEERKP